MRERVKGYRFFYRYGRFNIKTVHSRDTIRNLIRPFEDGSLVEHSP